MSRLISRVWAALSSFDFRDLLSAGVDSFLMRRRAKSNPALVSLQPVLSEPMRYEPFSGLVASQRRLRTVSILIWSAYFLQVKRPGASSLALMAISSVSEAAFAPPAR